MDSNNSKGIIQPNSKATELRHQLRNTTIPMPNTTNQATANRSSKASMDHQLQVAFNMDRPHIKTQTSSTDTSSMTNADHHIRRRRLLINIRSQDLTIKHPMTLITPTQTTTKHLVVLKRVTEV
jgi:hypothetical protein